MIKDESTGTWYDQFGSNFKVALRLALTSQAFDEDDDAPPGLPDSELPELPGELCGIWSYIKWETAGCPQRNQQEADEEYQKAIQVRTFTALNSALHILGCSSRLTSTVLLPRVLPYMMSAWLPVDLHAITCFCLHWLDMSRIAVRLNCTLCAWQELQSYLRKGIQLDELWRVARGEIQYKDFSSSQTGNGATAAPPSVPEELVRYSGCLTVAIIACQTEAG